MPVGKIVKKAPSAARTEGYPVEEGWHKVTMMDCTEVERVYHVGKKRGEPQFDDKGKAVMASFFKWDWKFTTVQDGIRLRVSTKGGSDVTEGSLSIKILSSLLGVGDDGEPQTLSAGEEFSTDMFKGMECEINIEHGKPVPRSDGNGDFYPLNVIDAAPVGYNDIEIDLGEPQF